MDSLKQARIHLLAYHNMGEAKIDIIHGPQRKLGLNDCPPDRVKEVANWFELRGVEAIAGA